MLDRVVRESNGTLSLTDIEEMTDSSSFQPNKVTLAAVEEGHTGSLPRFATVGDLLKDLHEDSDE